jgi:phosphoribosylaminoimidazole-succinocarboxamide synthase
MPLRAGYQMASKLDEPIFTPSTKAEQGLHDENISFEKAKEIVGAAKAEKLKSVSIALYKRAAEYALTKGIIIADTKFEFGELDGEIILIDEALTPDSSRFWPADTYKVGSSPMSYDKQFVRDYLETLDWDKTPPAPALPEEIITKTQAKYLEAYERLTGAKL